MSENITKTLFKPFKISVKFPNIKQKLKDKSNSMIYNYLTVYHKEDYEGLKKGQIYLNDVLHGHRVEFVNWSIDVIQTGFMWGIALLLIPIFQSNVIWQYKFLLTLIPLGISIHILHSFIEFLRRGKT